MKIGIDIRNIGRNRTGSEMVVLELTKNILKIDKENEYVLLTDTNDKAVINYVKDNLELESKNNVKIVSLKFSVSVFSRRERRQKSMNKFIWAIWSLPKWVRKNNLDIYHAEYILPFFVPKKTKLITHIHDVSFKVYRQFIKKSDLFFLDILIPLSIKRANKIIAVSNFTKREIEKYYPQAQGKIEVAYNAVAEKREESDRKKIKEKYNLPEKYILYLGTLQPRKNVVTLVKAYLKIKDKLAGVGLVIAGNIDGYNVDKSLIKYKGNKEICFPGFVDENDKKTIMAQAEMFVFPSFYEGFGIPILEAMSANVPVVASDIQPHREVGGDACLYFDPTDLDNLAEKMYTVFIDENLQKRMIISGGQRLDVFSWQKSAQKMLEIYKNN